MGMGVSPIKLGFDTQFLRMGVKTIRQSIFLQNHQIICQSSVEIIINLEGYISFFVQQAAN